MNHVIRSVLRSIAGLSLTSRRMFSCEIYSIPGNPPNRGLARRPADPMGLQDRLLANRRSIASGRKEHVDLAGVIGEIDPLPIIRVVCPTVFQSQTFPVPALRFRV